MPQREYGAPRHLYTKRPHLASNRVRLSFSCGLVLVVAVAAVMLMGFGVRSRGIESVGVRSRGVESVGVRPRGIQAAAAAFGIF
jgi:hypothetical protein